MATACEATFPSIPAKASALHCYDEENKGSACALLPWAPKGPWSSKQGEEIASDK